MGGHLLAPASTRTADSEADPGLAQAFPHPEGSQAPWPVLTCPPAAFPAAVTVGPSPRPHITVFLIPPFKRPESICPAPSAAPTLGLHPGPSPHHPLPHGRTDEVTGLPACRTAPDTPSSGPFMAARSQDQCLAPPAPPHAAGPESAGCVVPSTLFQPPRSLRPLPQPLMMSHTHPPPARPNLASLFPS